MEIISVKDFRLDKVELAVVCKEFGVPDVAIPEFVESIHDYVHQYKHSDYSFGLFAEYDSEGQLVVLELEELTAVQTVESGYHPH